MTMNRRQLLGRAGQISGALWLASSARTSRLWSAVDSNVETTYGKVRGRSTAGRTARVAAL